MPESSVAASEYLPDAVYHDAGFQLPVTAGHVFATVTPPAGKYYVHIDRVAYGTGTPGIANNSYFAVGAAQYILPTAAALDINYDFDFWVQVDGKTALQVVAVGNGSNNIGVTAGLTATRIP